MKKICILKEGKGYWKEHGQSAYSGSLIELYQLIKDKDFEIVIGNHNDFEGKWEEIYHVMDR
ncbi:MAG: hypothetical protein AABY22_03325 [Nanoarchaeota archaeon]